MVTKITGQDWSEINAEGLPIKFDDELLDGDINVKEYFPTFSSVRGYDPSPFNMGIYCERKVNDVKLRSTQYVGVVPLMKREKGDERITDYPIIKISSRFKISPTEMLSEVLSGNDYYENPNMLKTRSYTENEWFELAKKKTDERVLFGIISGISQVDLSQSDGNSGKGNESDLGIVEAYGVFEIVDFVNKAKEICKKSLKKQSQRVEENLNCKVKGRILVQKQIKYNEVRGQKQKMYCAYNMMSEDIKENQIIKYTLHLCRKNTAIGDSLEEDIQFCMNSLCGVPLKKCTVADFIGLKNNGAYKQYKEVLAAAKKVISRYSLSYGENVTDIEGNVEARITNHKVMPYFIDMNLLFEYYCRALFRKAIDEYSSENTSKYDGFYLESSENAARVLFQCDREYMEKYWKDYYRDDDEEDNDKNQKVSLRHFFMARYIPDIVIVYKSSKNSKEQIVAVIDAKYSDIESAEKRSRTHQIMFYMKALNCNYGGLVSPSLKGRENPISSKVWENQKINQAEPKGVSVPQLCYIPLANGKNTKYYIDKIKKYFLEQILNSHLKEQEKLEKEKNRLKKEKEFIEWLKAQLADERTKNIKKEDIENKLNNENGEVKNEH